METKFTPPLPYSPLLSLPLEMGLHFLLPFLSLLFASIPILACGGILEPTFYDPKRAVQLSWRPRAFLYKGFLSHEECHHLTITKLARGKLVKSMVVDDAGEAVVNEIRTSSGMHVPQQEPENAEPMRVLHYEKNQKDEPHVDYFPDDFNIEHGGNRIATVLMSLSDVNKGGETIFPAADGGLTQLKDETWSDRARTGYAVKPNKGGSLLSFSLHVGATTDTRSLHGSCTVIEGEKWSATKWISVRSLTIRRIKAQAANVQMRVCSSHIGKPRGTAKRILYTW